MLGNWIVQTTTTTGTGDLTLAAVTGFPPASSQFVTNELLSYTIMDDATGAPVERGLGYLNGSGLLVRARPGAAMISGVYTGNSPAATALPAGTKRVICSPGSDSYDTTPNVAAGLGIAGYGDMHPQAGGSFTLAAVADQVYMIPFKHVIDNEVGAFVFRMPGTSGASGTTAKIAAYSVGLNGMPDVKLAEGSVAVTSNGVKTCTVTPFRPPARYFVAFLTDGVPVVSQQSGSVAGECWLGNSGTMVPLSYLIETGVTGVTFPATFALSGAIFSASRPTILAQSAA